MIHKNLDKIITGAALGAVASTLLPIAKATLLPIANLGVQGASGLINRGRTALQIAREEFEDIVAEAQFERMKKQLDKEISALDAEI